MNLWIRFIRVLITALFGRKMAPLDTSVTRFRVWPHDLDPNIHMNNGRYLTIMDLGRIDLTIRTGLGRQVIKNKWRPIAAAATIRFLRPLRPFKAFELRTRIMGWNQRYFFMEQQFFVDGHLSTEAVVRGTFLSSKHQRVTPAEVAASIGYEDESPPLSPEVEAWEVWDKSAGHHGVMEP